MYSVYLLKIGIIGLLAQIIGEVLRGIDNDTALIILSDHGFNSFRRAVHLNRWLLENGYLFLKEGTKESKEFFEDVDLAWRAQRAGWKTLFYPEAICYHLGNSSQSSRKIRQYLC